VRRIQGEERATCPAPTAPGRTYSTASEEHQLIHGGLSVLPSREGDRVPGAPGRRTTSQPCMHACDRQRYATMSVACRPTVNIKARPALPVCLPGLQHDARAPYAHAPAPTTPRWPASRGPGGGSDGTQAARPTDTQAASTRRAGGGTTISVVQEGR
jgi:hypothetical protein